MNHGRHAQCPAYPSGQRAVTRADGRGLHCPEATVLSDGPSHRGTYPPRLVTEAHTGFHERWWSIGLRRFEETGVNRAWHSPSRHPEPTPGVLGWTERKEMRGKGMSCHGLSGPAPRDFTRRALLSQKARLSVGALDEHAASRWPTFPGPPLSSFYRISEILSSMSRKKDAR